MLLLEKLGFKTIHKWYNLDISFLANVINFFTPLLSTHFPSAGLSATHFQVDWLLDWSVAAKWAQPLITQLTAAYPTH